MLKLMLTLANANACGRVDFLSGCVPPFHCKLWKLWSQNATCASPVDHTEAPPPPGKMTPPPTVLIQEEIGAEICQSTQTLAGLAEVPPPSHLYTGGPCGRVSPEHTGERPLPVYGRTQAVNKLVFFMLRFRCNHGNRPPFDLLHLHRHRSELWVNVTEARWRWSGDLQH